MEELKEKVFELYLNKYSKSWKCCEGKYYDWAVNRGREKMNYFVERYVKFHGEATPEKIFDEFVKRENRKYNIYEN